MNGFSEERYNKKNDAIISISKITDYKIKDHVADDQIISADIIHEENHVISPSMTPIVSEWLDFFSG
jgi:hypothetical protein